MSTLKTSGRKQVLLFLILFPALVGSGQNYDQGKKTASPDFKWPEGKRVAVSLTFDDARYSQIDKGIPLLDKYGFKATFYISPDNLLQRSEGWKAAVSNGHEIGNHLVVHPCSGNFEWSRSNALENYSLRDMAKEIDSASRFIYKTLGIKDFSFAYPCGQTYIGNGKDTKSYVPLIARKFETGRGWLGEAPNDPLYCNMSQLNGIELDGKSFDQVKKIIEDARKSGKWVVFAGHEMDNGGGQTVLLNTLDELCRYASDPANGVWLDTVHSIASYLNKHR